MMGKVMEARLPTVQRVVRVPSVSDGGKSRLKGVVEEEPADQALADADQLFHHFDGGKRADHPCHRAENASLRAGRDRSLRRRLREQGTIGRKWGAVCVRREGAEGGEMPVEGADRREHERLCRKI